MPENDFLPFATGVDATVLDQADYAVAAWVATGFQNGIADPAYLNKVWRQSSFVAACLAAFMQQQTGDAILDNGSVAGFLALLTQAILQPPFVLIEEQQASGTAAGTFTSGAWQTRLLNTKVEDTLDIAAIVANQVTLPAGIYLCRAHAVGNKVAAHAARLQNITGAATLLSGTTDNCGTGGVMTRSLVEGEFTLGAASTIALQHRCQTTEAADGFGAAAGFGVVEIYSRLELLKIG